MLQKDFEKLREVLGEEDYTDLVATINANVKRARDDGFAVGFGEGSKKAAPVSSIARIPGVSTAVDWVAARLSEPSSWASTAFLAYLSDNAIPALSQYGANKWAAAAAAVLGFVISEAKKRKEVKQ